MLLYSPKHIRFISSNHVGSLWPILIAKMSRFWNFFRHCLQVSKALKIWHCRANIRYQVLNFFAHNMYEILHFWMATSCEKFHCLLNTSFPKFEPCISEKKTCRCFAEAALVSQARCKIVRRLYPCTLFFVGYVSVQATRLTLCWELTHQRKVARGEVVKARKYQTSGKE